MRKKFEKTQENVKFINNSKSTIVFCTQNYSLYYNQIFKVFKYIA